MRTQCTHCGAASSNVSNSTSRRIPHARACTLHRSTLGVPARPRGAPKPAGAPSPRPLARCCTGAFRAAKLLAIAHGAMCVALRTRGSARWCCVLRLASQQQVTRFGSRHQVNAESNFGIRLSTRSFDKLAQVPLPIARPMILAATALPHAPTPRTEVLGPFELIRGAPTNSTHTCFSPA